MSLSSTDEGLLTPDNCAVIFIDDQPQMLFGVDNIAMRSTRSPKGLPDGLLRRFEVVHSPFLRA